VGVPPTSYTYEAHGTRTAQQGSNTARQRANTKEEDPTGLLNEGFRYRDLESGLFISRDPLGFVDGPNVYTYVRQNPWSAFDPLGLATTFNNEQASTSTDIPEPPPYQSGAEHTQTVPSGQSARDLQGVAAFTAQVESERTQPQIDWSNDHGPALWSLTASNSELNSAADSPNYSAAQRKMFAAQSQANSDGEHNYSILSGSAQGGSMLLNPPAAGLKGLAAMYMLIKGISYADDAARAAKGIATPHGLALQADTAAARTALGEVQSGATVYRQGSFGVQNTADAQFWSLQNPAGAQGFANKMGMPGGSGSPDWIMGGTISRGSPVITRPAPSTGTNVGGAMEAVVPKNGVSNLWFHMPD